MAGDIVIAAIAAPGQRRNQRLVDQSIFQITLEPLQFEQADRDMVDISIQMAMALDVSSFWVLALSGKVSGKPACPVCWAVLTIWYQRQTAVNGRSFI